MKIKRFWSGVTCTVLLLLVAAALFGYVVVWVNPAWNPMPVSPIEWIDLYRSGEFAMTPDVHPFNYWFALVAFTCVSWGIPLFFLGFGLFVLLHSVPEIWRDGVRW